MPQKFNKAPTELLDYVIDWRDTSDPTLDPYLESGETIVTSVWSAETGITIGTPASSNTTTTAKVWVSGGAVRQKEYKVTNTITTSNGRTAVRTLFFSIVETK